MTAHLAVLRDQPADPIAHAQARPTIGMQQFMLHNLDATMAFPVFLEQNNGRIQRFLMMKAMIANVLTNQAQRALQDVWLLIPGNPRISKNANTGEVYYGDQSEGMIFAHLRNLVQGKPLFNSMTAMVTMRSFHCVPNRKYGAEQGYFLKNNMPELGKQHITLCGGKRKINDAEVLVEPMMPNTEEFSTFLREGLEQTKKFFGSLMASGKGEPNIIFQVLPGTIQMGNVPFYRSALGDALMANANNGIRRFSTVSNWNGAVKINTTANKSITGNGQELIHGIRETGGKYSFDRIGSIYDRRLNILEARVSMIDPVTIRYLEGAQQHDQEGEEEGVNTNIPVTNRRSRAKVLEEVAKEVGFIQYLNAELKVYPNGKNADSMAISVEVALNEHSTYTGIKDTSKLGSLAQSVSEDEMVEAVLADYDPDQIEAILAGTVSLTKVEDAPAAPAPAVPTHAGDISTELSDDLPF